MNDNFISAQKSALRPEMRARRKALGLVQRSIRSRAICARLNEVVAGVSACALYLSMPQEADIEAFIEARLECGLRIAAPRGQDFAWLSDLRWVRRRAFGMREPDDSNPECPLQLIECVLLPGLAFDEDGGRLGQGGGWYDRVLPTLKPDVWRIGVCFECQVVESVPREAHDQSVHFLVTESQTRAFSNP